MQEIFLKARGNLVTPTNSYERKITMEERFLFPLTKQNMQENTMMITCGNIKHINN